VGITLAHEWAHAAQQQLGIFDDPRIWNIQKELQADCLAGVYIDYAIFESDFITIEPGDIQEAAISRERAGDPEGTPLDHPQAHGNGQQRVDAFYAGFNHGFAACWEYTSVPGVLP
jgi:predicted metalloprotease